MSHEIKRNRAKEKSQVGRFRLSFGSIWESIPNECKAKLPSGALASLCDAMRHSHDIGRASAIDEMCDA